MCIRDRYFTTSNLNSFEYFDIKNEPSLLNFLSNILGSLQENDKRWEQNEKRWEDNDKRWEENRKRWEENDKRWKENDKRWEKYEIDRKTDHRELLDILTQFDRTISKKIGDPNADKMNKIIDISKIKR